MPQNTGLHVLPLSAVILCGSFILVSIHLEPSSPRHTDTAPVQVYNTATNAQIYVSWTYLDAVICLGAVTWEQETGDENICLNTKLSWLDRKEQKWSWSPSAPDTRHQGTAHHIELFTLTARRPVWVTCARLVIITDKWSRWRMERKESREWEGQKNIFTGLHCRSLSPGGVVRKGWAALLTAFMATGCERMEDGSLTWDSYNPTRLTVHVTVHPAQLESE